MIAAVQGNTPISAYFPSCASIKETILKIVNLIKEIILFPFRYVGSKAFGGYRYTKPETISKEETREKIDLICSTAFIHQCDDHWITPFGYEILSPNSFSDIDTLEKREKCFYDPSLGLKATVVQKGDQFIVTFGALGSHLSEVEKGSWKDKQIYTELHGYGILNGLGFVPSVYEKADLFAEKLLQDPRLKGKKVTFTGQCYGGSIAQYVALKHQKEAFCANSLPIGAGLQRNIGNEKLKNAPHLVHHFTVEKDWMTNSALVEIFDLFLSILCIKTPGNFGRRTIIPSAYNTSKASHDFVCGSAMVYLGHDKRAHPKDIL